MNYYLVNIATRDVLPYTIEYGNAEQIQYLNDLAKEQGLKAMSEEDLTALKEGKYPEKLREEGRFLGRLTEDYIKDPKGTTQRMIDAGFDPRDTKTKTASALATFAPATEYASAQGMSVPKVLGAIGVDVLGSLLGGGAGGAVTKALGARGASLGARYGAGVLADAGANAVASGAQQGYGKGEINPEDLKTGALFGGGLGALGGGAKALGIGGFKGLASELSGVSPEALETFSKTKEGREAILNAVGSKETADKLLYDLEHIQDLTPEGKRVTEILTGKEMQTYPYAKTLQGYIDAMGVNGVYDPQELKALAPLEQWKQTFADMAMSGSTPANKLRLKRSALDQAIDYNDPSIGRGAGAIAEKGLKQVSGQIRQDLKDRAGTEYAELMDRWAQKINAGDELKHMLGSNQFTMEQRAEGVLDNLFNRNKGNVQKTVKQFDDIFGKGYLEEAKNNWMAKQLGIDLTAPIAERAPSIMPMQYTGRSGLGMALSNANPVGDAGKFMTPFKLPAMVAMSPRFATKTLSEMYNPSTSTKVAGATAKQGKSYARNKKSEEKDK